MMVARHPPAVILPAVIVRPPTARIDRWWRADHGRV